VLLGVCFVVIVTFVAMLSNLVLIVVFAFSPVCSNSLLLLLSMVVVDLAVVVAILLLLLLLSM